MDTQLMVYKLGRDSVVASLTLWLGLETCDLMPEMLDYDGSITKAWSNPKIDTRISVCVSRSGDPPWILKRGGLERSGRRLISSISKTK